MRLTLFWSSAVTFPTVMVRIAIALSTGTQSVRTAPSVLRPTRTRAAKPAALAPADMNAVTEVGAPS